MEEILFNYKSGKYKKCLELIELLPEIDDFVENFIRENCSLICESMVKIYEKNSDEVLDIQSQLYSFWDKVTSVDMSTNCIPLELKLTSTINFLYWLLFHNDSELIPEEIDCYIELLGNILHRVLGKKESLINVYDSSEVLDCLCSFKSFLHNQDNKIVLLTVELVTIVLLYLCRLKRTLTKNCVEIINLFTSEFNECSKTKEILNEFLGIKKNSLCLFKFGLIKKSSILSEMNEDILYFIYLLKSALLYMNGDFKGSLKSLQKNLKCVNKTIWNYLGVLNCYELENWDLCLGFLYKGLEIPMPVYLKARYLIMKGKLESVKRNYTESVRCLEEALSLCPNLPVIYYYIGQGYGRMGLSDLMVSNFEKVVEVLQEYSYEENGYPSFESTILKLIHPDNEISEIEALYALGKSYGLNERYHKAAETFDKLLKLIDLDKPMQTTTVVQLPNHLTILHEASVINLLIGNLVRAEQFAFDAMERYNPEKEPQKPKLTQTNWNKDIGWLRKLIHQELLESDLEPKELQNETQYTEEVFFIFKQNVIALLILSEIQRIQEVDEYKTTLSKILSIFSSFLASICKKKEVSDEENYTWMLVKALAGKTCLRIVSALGNNKDNSNVEKMYQRALSCNKGDKDALLGYYKWLLDCGRSREALKMWKTFSKEKSTISIDEVQSSALKYFLISKVSKREVDEIQAEIEFSAIELS